MKPFDRILKTLILAFVYYITAKAGLMLDAVSGFATLVWPPSGIALAALVIFGAELWPGIFIGAFLVNLVSGAPFLSATGVAIGNTVEAIVAFSILTKLGYVSLERMRDSVIVVFCCSLFSTVFSASIGVAVLVLGHKVALDDFGKTWVAWWLGDMGGILVIFPLLVSWKNSRLTQTRGKRPHQFFEAIALALTLILTSLFLMGITKFGPIDSFIYSYLFFAILIWAAFRFGVRGTAISTLFVAVITIVSTFAGYGPFMRRTLSESLLPLQVFLNSLAGVSLILAAAISEEFQTKKNLELSEEQLKREKSKAEEANQTKSSFLAAMSHEIRNPLGSILGFTHILTDPHLSEFEKKKYSEIIHRNGELLSKLIDDILDLSKIEANKLDIEAIVFSPKDLIQETLAPFQRSAQEKGISLELICDEMVPDKIISDPTRLKQILINLLSNAIKFTEKGSVSVKVSPTDIQSRAGLSIVVQDSGHGLTKEEQSRLFQPFIQSDFSTTRKHGGTGLGLYISRRLAQFLGGDVTLFKSTLDSGSAFEIKIRTRLKDLESKISEVKILDVAAEAKIKGIKVLVVEDGLDNQTLIEHILVKKGASVDMADDGEQGVAKALSQNFDIILMDIQMPVLNGLDAAARLRQAGYKKPIIALTGYALKEQRRKIRDSGFDDHVTKPVQAPLLLSSISNLLFK